MTFGQGHDTLLGHGQQLCEILSRSNTEGGYKVMAQTQCEQTDSKRQTG